MSVGAKPRQGVFSFIYSALDTHLLCSRHCSRRWSQSSEPDRDLSKADGPSGWGRGARELSGVTEMF